MDQAHLILFQIYVSYSLSAGIFLFSMRISNSGNYHHYQFIWKETKQSDLNKCYLSEF